jgi:hypothetical protein
MSGGPIGMPGLLCIADMICPPSVPRKDPGSATPSNFCRRLENKFVVSSQTNSSWRLQCDDFPELWLIDVLFFWVLVRTKPTIMVKSRKGHQKQLPTADTSRRLKSNMVTNWIRYIVLPSCTFFVLLNIMVLPDAFTAGIKTRCKENGPEPIQGISLITSFFAIESSEDGGTIGQARRNHHQEIEAALLANMQNPHFRQVVVVYDSVTDKTMDCRDFVVYMTQKLEKLEKSTRTVPLVVTALKKNESINWTDVTKNPMMVSNLPQLECIEFKKKSSSTGQPTYLEMFQYATHHPIVTSDKVILSNADQVFDDTLSNAKFISNQTIFVLSTHGYSMNTPYHIRAQYHALLGDEKGRTTKSWCEPSPGPDGVSDSWDAYIFHRSLLKAAIPLKTTNDHGDDRFTRLNFWRKPMVYYMNELGAEYAALYDIVKGLQGKVTVWNACSLIRTWHFHLEPKMHYSDSSSWRWPSMTSQFGGGYIFYEDFGPRRSSDGSLKSNITLPNEPVFRVPTPSLFVPFCPDYVACFLEIPFSDNFQNFPQEDASQFVNS